MYTTSYTVQEKRDSLLTLKEEKGRGEDGREEGRVLKREGKVRGEGGGKRRRETYQSKKEEE
jgi:hypothetical protein